MEQVPATAFYEINPFGLVLLPAGRDRPSAPLRGGSDTLLESDLCPALPTYATLYTPVVYVVPGRSSNLASLVSALTP